MNSDRSFGNQSGGGNYQRPNQSSEGGSSDNNYRNSNQVGATILR